VYTKRNSICYTYFGATMEYTYFRVNVAKTENNTIKLGTTVLRKRNKIYKAYPVCMLHHHSYM
jgi:hypothetical protein